MKQAPKENLQSLRGGHVIYRRRTLGIREIQPWHRLEKSDLGCGLKRLSGSSNKRCEKFRTQAIPLAMIQVDYSQPAIWLGLGLIGGGLGLYQLRRVQPILSKDSDIVVSSVLIFSGGILVFQGWRLDPLLLFCQLLTAGTALSWALEAINLRKTVDNTQQYDDRARQLRSPVEDPRRRGRTAGQNFQLPPPMDEEAQYTNWYVNGPPVEAQYEDVPSTSGRGNYAEDYRRRGNLQEYYGDDGYGGREYQSGDEGYYDRQSYNPSNPGSNYEQQNYQNAPPQQNLGRNGDQYPDGNGESYSEILEGYREKGPSFGVRNDDYENARDTNYPSSSSSYQGGNQQGSSWRSQEGDYDQSRENYSQQDFPYDSTYMPETNAQDDSDRGRQNSARRPQPGVVTEVESFYNRPKTVIDGVEQFYVESLESDAQQGQSPKTEESGSTEQNRRAQNNEAQRRDPRNRADD